MAEDTDVETEAREFRILMRSKNYRVLIAKIDSVVLQAFQAYAAANTNSRSRLGEWTMVEEAIRDFLTKNGVEIETS
jgi:hypothetical protein